MAVMDGEPLGDVASGRLLSVLFLEVNKCMLLFHVHLFVELRAFTIVNVYALYTCMLGHTPAASITCTRFF